MHGPEGFAKMLRLFTFKKCCILTAGDITDKITINTDPLFNLFVTGYL